MSNQPHESGRFGEVYGEEDFLDAVRELQPAGTQEVADAVGCTRQNADYRLRKLEDEGKVASEQIGNSLAWSIPEEEQS